LGLDSGISAQSSQSDRERSQEERAVFVYSGEPSQSGPNRRFVPMISGDEFDAFLRFRRYIAWKPGERKRIKRAYNRRLRHTLAVR